MECLNIFNFFHCYVIDNILITNLYYVGLAKDIFLSLGRRGDKKQNIHFLSPFKQQILFILGTLITTNLYFLYMVAMMLG